MDLLQQFQGVLGSLLLGGLFYFGLSVINILLKHRFLIVLWYILLPLYFAIFTISYYVFMCYFTYGIYNFFFTFSLLGGMLIYHILYLPGVERITMPIRNKIDSKMKKVKLKKIRLKIKRNDKKSKSKRNKKELIK